MIRMNRQYRAGRLGGMLTAFAASALLVGCSDLLTVDNPGAITEPELDDPARIPLMVHGVVGEFQPAHSWYALYTGTFSDELTDTHVWRENRPIDLRQVDETNGLLATNYTRLQRARAAGDITAERIRSILGAEAESHIGVARSLAYAGYALTLLAESYCEVPINVSRAYSPNELFDMAMERFDDAIAVAGRARSAGNVASADSLEYLARVGAARAALNRGAGAAAAAYAAPVPMAFEFWSAHSSNSTLEYNQFWNATRPVNAHLELGPTFQGLDDPRIPEPVEPKPMQNNFEGLIPYRPMNYAGWAPGDTLMIEQNTSVRFASGLEARYIVAEVEGPTAATLLFINERREAGGQDPVVLVGDAMMAELREQRRRDLYLTGHRLGDLRRYLSQGMDYFPSGTWPHSAQTYGTDVCFPLPLSERNSNPNL
jgi:hypothetical protein